MSNLDRLMGLEGASAAFEFSDTGELKDHRVAEGSNLTPETLDLLAHVFVANIAIATMQARGWEKTTGQGGFYPITGFTLVGFEWSTVGNGHRGVVLRNDVADFEAAYAELDSAE
jgi:roadblock/LC7 domain-containing protein